MNEAILCEVRKADYMTVVGHIVCELDPSEWFSGVKFYRTEWSGLVVYPLRYVSPDTLQHGGLL